MAYGLQVFNASGSVVMDSTTRCGRVMGTFSTGTSNGSVNITPPGSSTLWAALVSPKADIGDGSGAPGLSISGTTISWTFSTGTGPSSLVVYGCF